MRNHRSHRAELIASVEKLAIRRNQPSSATLLKEYELLRTEITTSLQLQQQTLSFGIATLGLLAGVAFVGPEDRYRSDILVIFLPLIAYLALTVWFSEVMRMLRAGGFLLKLEKEIDDCGDGSLHWERTVAAGRLKYPIWKPYFGVLDPDQLRLLSVTLLFFTIAVASIMLGWGDASNIKRGFAVGAGTLAVAVVLLLYQLRIDQLEDILGVDPKVRWVSRLMRYIGSR